MGMSVYFHDSFGFWGGQLNIELKIDVRSQVGGKKKRKKGWMLRSFLRGSFLLTLWPPLFSREGEGRDIILYYPW
jgi:hypothetical protein